MRMSRRVFENRAKTNARGVLVFCFLLIAATLWASGCAGVVGAGNSSQPKPAPLLISVNSLPAGTSRRPIQHL